MFKLDGRESRKWIYTCEREVCAQPHLHTVRAEIVKNLTTQERELIERRLTSLSTTESPGMVQVCPETDLNKTYIHYLSVEYATCPRDEQGLGDSTLELTTTSTTQRSNPTPSPVLASSTVPRVPPGFENVRSVAPRTVTPTSATISYVTATLPIHHLAISPSTGPKSPIPRRDEAREVRDEKREERDSERSSFPCYSPSVRASFLSNKPSELQF